MKKKTRQHVVDEVWEILNESKPNVFEKAVDYHLDAIDESNIC